MSGNDESVLDVLHAAANGGTGPTPMRRAHDRVAELIAAAETVVQAEDNGNLKSSDVYALSDAIAACKG